MGNRKGQRKRQAAGKLFQKGEVAFPELQTAGEDEDEIQPGPSSTPDEVIQEDDAANLWGLRSQPDLKTEDAGENLGNRIMDMRLFFTTFNETVREHKNFPADCDNMELMLHRERKVGLGADLNFACKTCHFVSRTYRPCTENLEEPP